MSATNPAVERGVRAVHGDRWPRRAGRAALRPFRTVNEVTAAVAVGERLQRSTSTGRRIVVDDLGTDADTSVVTALLARAFAHYRHDRVLAVDATGRAPSLDARLDVHGAHELGSGVDVSTFEAARTDLGEVGGGLWTAPVGRDDAESYESRLLPLSRFFGVTLVAGSSGGAFVDAVGGSAHARVRVVRATRAAAVRAGRLLDELVRDGRGDEVERTVVVLFDEERREDPGFDAVRAARILAESGAAVVRLRHDRHLAQELAVRPRKIAEATHRAALELAAEALNRAVDADRQVPRAWKGARP